MLKKQKTTKRQQIAVHPVVSVVDRIDRHALERICVLKNLIPGQRTIITAINERLSGGNLLETRYISQPDFPYGLLEIMEPGLMDLKFCYRAMISWKDCHELQMKDLSANIASQLFTRHFGEGSFPLLSSYVRNPNQMCDDLKKKHSIMLHGKTCDDVNELFVLGIHHKRYTSSVCMQHIPELKLWTNMLKILVTRLIDFKPYSDFFPQDGNRSCDENTAEFLSRVIQFHERKCLTAMRAYFELFGPHLEHLPGSILTNGVLVTRKCNHNLKSVDTGILLQCGNFIQNETTFLLDVFEKINIPTNNDNEWFSGPTAPVHVDKRDQLKNIIIEHAKSHKFMRFNGFVYHIHNSIPGALVQVEHIDCLVKRLYDTTFQLKEQVKLKHVLKWANKTQHPDFAILDPSHVSNHLILFVDGHFDIRTQQYRQWTTSPDEIQMSMHYFDEVFPCNPITPLWDQFILGSQHDQDMKSLFLAMFGRLMFRNGEMDNWGVVLFVVVDDCVEKRIIHETVIGMLPGLSVSVNPKLTKGAATSECRAVIVDSLSADVTDSASTKKLMDIVFGNERTIIPIIVTSPSYPKQKDIGGRVSRHLAIFHVEETYVEYSDDIAGRLNAELASFLVIAVGAYHQYVNRKANSFWCDAPKQLTDNRIQYKEETCKFFKFLLSGTAQFSVTIDNSSCTSLTQLEKIFQSDFHDQIDGHVLKDLGFIKVKKNVCASCADITEDGKCVCPIGGRGRRIKRTYFQNMKVVQKYFEVSEDEVLAF